MESMPVVGLDVHAAQTQAAVLDLSTGELRQTRLKMPPVHVLGFLEGLGPRVRAAYEAGPTGFGLARAAAQRGVDVRVIAAGKTPRAGGIVPSEHTSDTKRRQGSITKAGPIHARRLLVEAAHHYRHNPTVGDTLARRQQGQDPRIIEIAWRAQRRLHQRWQTLARDRRKPSSVVAIACARELAAFCWEATTLN